MKFNQIWAPLLCVLLIAGCDAADITTPSHNLTSTEKSSLDRIFADIKRASRESFEQDDWSIMAKLYTAGALACWDASGEDHQFGFLSMKGIPESAEYSVGSLGNYVFGGQDTSQMGGTHFMAIKYTETFLEGCDLPVRQRWPERHFYLRRHDGVFQLVHFCPLQEQIEQKSITRVWPVTSGKRAVDVVANMPADEIRALLELVKRDKFPLNAMIAIQRKYNLTEAESAIALERVCNAH